MDEIYLIELQYSIHSDGDKMFSKREHSNLDLDLNNEVENPPSFS